MHDDPTLFSPTWYLHRLAWRVWRRRSRSVNHWAFRLSLWAAGTGGW